MLNFVNLLDAGFGDNWWKILHIYQNYPIFYIEEKESVFKIS